MKRPRRVVVVCAIAALGAGAGSGTASAASAPSAPSSVSAVPRNGSATLRWRAPARNGGSPVTGYQVTPYIGRSAQSTRRFNSSATTQTITRLSNGKTYRFVVAARNAAGTGPRSPASYPVTVGAPTAARSPYAVAGRGKAAVHWKAPANSNGARITWYVVTPYQGGVARRSVRTTSATTTATVTGLTSGKRYTFRVAARNARGVGPRSIASNATTIAYPCRGVTMTAGQADIARHGTGTRFCLSGRHNWTLTPKAGDSLIGPAVLDGANSRAHAIVARAPKVTLTDLTIQHYNNGNGSQDGAIHIADDNTAKATASGWHLNNLDVGFNSASGSGSGNGWTFTGGRFHDNRQQGIGGAMGNGVTINRVEIDHNDFTDTTYTKRNWDCGDEAGGVKWVTDNMTIENSRIHDNACKGLWADLGARHSTITNNHVYNNWDEGIFIEISSGATVTRNRVTGNGKRNYNRSGSGCPWLFAGGITLNSSDHVVIADNTVSGNCNGITGVQQDRPDGSPGLLENDSIHDNTIAGPGGKTGVSADNGADLRTRNIAFANNTYRNGMSFCAFSC